MALPICIGPAIACLLLFSAVPLLPNRRCIIGESISVESILAQHIENQVKVRRLAVCSRRWPGACIHLAPRSRPSPCSHLTLGSG